MSTPFAVGVIVTGGLYLLAGLAFVLACRSQSKIDGESFSRSRQALVLLAWLPLVAFVAVHEAATRRRRTRSEV